MISCNDDYVPRPVLIADARLEALDAKMETLYNTETIMMELTLSEPEDNDRPDFDDDFDDDFEDDFEDDYEEYSLSDRFNEDDDVEYCSECNEKREIVAYGWRNENDNLCLDCVNLPGMDDYEC